jgi:hypothetical protein
MRHRAAFDDFGRGPAMHGRQRKKTAYCALKNARNRNRRGAGGEEGRLHDFGRQNESHFLSTIHGLRDNNDGWVPTSDMNFGELEAVTLEAVTLGAAFAPFASNSPRLV